jgi:acylphosphatase
VTNDAQRATVVVHGRVQGVFYRASAMQEAQALGLSGYALNLPDGGVELVAEGPRAALEDFVAWCRQGPPAAHVEEVQLKWSAARGEFRTFSIEHG